ncbi:hypothetical protein ABZV58_18065 [Nocardia sp. NPDC004654]|uniref:hypothetical protein n=1 Tax=Nocardia sp. NPDC004654 TaxID=3154776 RepID=UPI0033BDACB6
MGRIGDPLVTSLAWISGTRGILSEQTLGTYSNLDDAIEALVGAIVAYLER